MINVVEGASAYYNFQGEETPGVEWVYNVFFTADGVINFAEGGNNNVLASTFVPGDWTKMSVDVDLNNNVWALSVNDECVGSFQNAANNLASLNLFPTEGDDYFIDDVNMNYTPDGENNVTDAMISLNANLPIGVLGGTLPISGTVNNLGEDLIQGFTISYDGMDESFDETIEVGGSYAFTLEAVHPLTEGTSEARVTLSGIDNDQNACNNISTLVARSISVPRGKKYVALT